MIRVETDRSYWFFDEDRKTYVRTPKNEKPRDPKHEEGRGMKDLTPHPYVGYRVFDHFLLILAEDGEPDLWVYGPRNGFGGTPAEISAAMRDLLAANR